MMECLRPSYLSFLLLSPTSLSTCVIVKKHSQTHFYPDNLSSCQIKSTQKQRSHNRFITSMSPLLFTIWSVKMWRSYDWAACIHDTSLNLLVQFVLRLVCLSACICLTNLHPRGEQAQLHPQCGVRLPFSQRCAEAATNNSCTMLI